MEDKIKTQFNYKKKNLNEEIEIFVGKNAGKHILRDLFSTENEITLITSYIDEIRVSDLFVLAQKGIKVNLAFDNLHSRGRDSILRKLIIQEVETDMEAILDKASSKRWLNLLVIIFAVIGASSLAYTAYSFNQTPEEGINILSVGIGVIAFLIAMVFEVMRQLVVRRKVNTYSYTERINFKYFKNNLKENRLDASIIIIDNRIAYLTSMDFVRKDYEESDHHWTRFTNPEKIKELKDYTDGIFASDNKLNTHQTSWLAQKLYKENQ